jgi:hypothetical protein
MGSVGGQFASFPEGLFLPFLFSLDPGAGFRSIDQHGKSHRPLGGDVPRGLLAPFGQASYCFRYECGQTHGLEAINIDTGAVYGSALTALGLSRRYLEHGLMPILTVKTSGGQRSRDGKIMARSISVPKFGGLLASTGAD